jgi:hypothetical protein
MLAQFVKEREMFLRMVGTRPWFLAWGFAAVALFLSSCGDAGRRTVYPAYGRVLFEGQPVPNAQVILHPLTSDDKDHPVRPTGRVGADGSVTLTTYTAGDGAPEGEYAVTVDLRRRPPDAEGDVTQSVLPARYLKPETSPLRVQIKKGTNELAPFELTRR